MVKEIDYRDQKQDVMKNQDRKWKKVIDQQGRKEVDIFRKH